MSQLNAIRGQCHIPGFVQQALVTEDLTLMHLETWSDDTLFTVVVQERIEAVLE
jgi:hypothetical protein